MKRFYIKPLLTDLGRWGVFDNGDTSGRHVWMADRAKATFAARILNADPAFANAYDWTKD